MSGAGLLMLAIWLAPRRGLPVMPRAVEDEGVLRVAYVQPVWPDPHSRGFPLPTQNQFVLCLWEPLIECDPETGQPQPAAAASWRWSDDRRTLTIALRRDGRWSTGEPVTAGDFVRAWRRLLRQATDQAAVLFPVENAEKFHREKSATGHDLGLEAVDDFTLRIKLTAVRSTFVAELADPLLSPLHESTGPVLKERRPRRAPEALVSNGAFRLEHAHAEGFRLKANPHYHDRAAVRLKGVSYFCADSFRMARLLVAPATGDGLIVLTNGSDGNAVIELLVGRWKAWLARTYPDGGPRRS